MKILMIPGEGQEGDRTTGISAVVHKYIEYLKKLYSVEFVKKDQDLVVSHAGVTGKLCDVSILHGIYWTGDYSAPHGEYAVNARIVDGMRSAKEITVPANWVKKTIERDFRVSPTVINHGIEWQEWQVKSDRQDYILWNKNRMDNVCDPMAMQMLAEKFPQKNFISTFAYKNAPNNINVIGKQSFDNMKQLVLDANVYLSLVKETFGIGTLEAMAAGVPVLGWNYGGNVDLVKHKVNGYLANFGDYDDLKYGLDYCLKYRDILGENGRELARAFTWEDAVTKLYSVLERALNKKSETVSVIIPTYNYADKIDRAIESVCTQTYKPKEIIVVDDGSSDDPSIPVEKFKKEYPAIDIKLIRQENSGVAIARNTGFQESTGDFICCLDPDDMIRPEFLNICVDALKRNPDVYTAYTRLWWIKPDGSEGLSEWPSEYKYNKMLKKLNQVPTCNVSRREVWERLGGQRQRYAPIGAGTEDANMWFRAGAYGMGAMLATSKPLFIYSWMSGIVSGNKEYQEVDFRKMCSWWNDDVHPFASHATPKNKISHNVYQYDEPLVSIIIPVAERHIKNLFNTLDSVDGQLFRKWEIVVIDDTKSGISDFIKNAYPFVAWCKTPKPESGASIARNIGVKNTANSSELILFLDADDEFADENALGEMMRLHYFTGDIVFTNYIIKVNVKSEDVATKRYGKNLIKFDNIKHEAFVNSYALKYDCKTAQENNEYNWCIVSCLVPKKIHNEIGGFDETLMILEDFEYYKRIAKAGHCFRKMDNASFIIDRTEFVEDEKTQNNINRATKKIINKLERIKNMACRGCGKGSTSVALSEFYNESYKNITGKASKTLDDSDFIKIEYVTNQGGDRKIVGVETGINYGYRTPGDIFLVHKKDLSAGQNIFRKIDEFPIQDKTVNSNIDVSPQRLAATEEEKEQSEKIFQEIIAGSKGVTINNDKIVEPITEDLLFSLGLSRNTKGALKKFEDLKIGYAGMLRSVTVEQLTDIDGIGKVSAEKFIANVKEYIES